MLPIIEKKSQRRNISQKLPVYGFERVEDISEFDEIFVKSYNEESDEEYFLEAEVQYPENLHNLYNDLPFLPETMKTEKVEKLEANLQDKVEYVVNIRTLKQALNHSLTLKKVHRMIKFNQKAQLNSYIYMNTDLRKEAKNDFEKDFFKLMNNSVFGKCEKTRDIKLVTTEKRRNYLLSKPNHHTKKFFTENLLDIEMRKTEILMNKPVYQYQI